MVAPGFTKAQPSLAGRERTAPSKSARTGRRGDATAVRYIAEAHRTLPVRFVPAAVTGIAPGTGRSDVRRRVRVRDRCEWRQPNPGGRSESRAGPVAVVVAGLSTGGTPSSVEPAAVRDDRKRVADHVDSASAKHHPGFAFPTSPISQRRWPSLGDFWRHGHPFRRPVPILSDANARPQPSRPPNRWLAAAHALDPHRRRWHHETPSL